jgi:hypothetical protein
LKETRGAAAPADKTVPDPRGFGSMDALRIAVDPKGKPWVVTRDQQLFCRVADGWRQLPGKFSDVAVGANYAVWALGPAESRTRGGYPIYHWNGSAWEELQGAAVRIAVDPQGMPWVVSDAGALFRLAKADWHPDGFFWQDLPGRVSDIAVGPDGSAWALGPAEERTPEGLPILRWDGAAWAKVPGAARRIAVGPKGVPWVINEAHNVFRLQDGLWWGDLPGMAIEIAVGADGSAWALGRAKDGVPAPIVSWDGGQWKPLDGRAGAAPSAPPAAPAPGASARPAGLPAPPRGGTPVVFFRNGANWRKLAGRVREIKIEGDGSAWVRFEEGDRVPLAGGTELFIPDERTRGVAIQINTAKKPPDG